jgi:hypothetical protein
MSLVWDLNGFSKMITYGNPDTWQLQEGEAEKMGAESILAKTLLGFPDWSQHYSLGSYA